MKSALKRRPTKVSAISAAASPSPRTRSLCSSVLDSSMPRPRFFSARYWLLISSVGFLFLSACSPRETAVERGNREQILHRGIGHDLASLDPQLATQASDYNVLS